MNDADGLVSGNRRQAHIDGVRALAALYVVVHHCCNNIFRAGQVPTALQIFGYGKIAVAVFIVISGYSLTLQTARNGNRLQKGALAFYKRRTIRIVPTYLAALACSVLAALTVLNRRTGSVWDYALPVSTTGMLKHAALLQDLHLGTSSYTPNYAFWSIAIEYHIYFLLPALLLLQRIKEGKLLLVLAACFALLLGSYPVGFLVYVHTRDWFYFALFIAGILASSLTVDATTLRNATWRWTYVAAALWVTTLVAIVLLSRFSGLPPITQIWVELLGGIATAATLVVAEQRHSGMLRCVLGAKPFARIGVFSYSLYLVHVPVIQAVLQYVVRPMDLSGSVAFAVLACVSVPLSVVVSRVFFEVFERPFVHGRFEFKRRATGER